MASVPLRFLAPQDDDIAALRIYESPLETGSFSMIERVTSIGTYPNYIDEYTTTLASNVNDWFAIAWEDAAGVVGDMSIPVQGATQTLVFMLVDRVKLRDSSLDERIVAQEAEAAISSYYNVMNPFDVDPATVSPKIMSGLTMLTLARAMLTRLFTTATTANKWAAGILSMDTSATKGTTQAATIQKLIDIANTELGLNYSVILLMEEISVGGTPGFKTLKVDDVSRTMIELG